MLPALTHRSTRPGHLPRKRRWQRGSRTDYPSGWSLKLAIRCSCSLISTMARRVVRNFNAVVARTDCEHKCLPRPKNHPLENALFLKGAKGRDVMYVCRDVITVPGPGQRSVHKEPTMPQTYKIPYPPRTWSAPYTCDACRILGVLKLLAD